MNAIDLLKEDHDKAKDAIKKIEKTNTEDVQAREELFQTLVDDLTAHERIEEEIFYPALVNHEKAKALVLESYVEHGVVDTLIDEISAVAVSDEAWMPAFKVFRENLTHHIEEEEGELFPKTKQIFSEEQLEKLGDQMAALKAETKQEILEDATEEV